MSKGVVEGVIDRDFSILEKICSHLYSLGEVNKNAANP
jgi:hypothetical protein